MRWVKEIFFLLAPDDGGPGSSGAGAPETNTPVGGNSPKDAPGFPKFAHNLSPDRQEKYKDFLCENYREKSLNEVVDDLYGMKNKMERALFIPDREKPDPDERAAFLKTLGIPEKPDNYELKTEKYKDMPGLKEFTDDFRSKVHAYGLNQNQAQAVMEYMLDIAKTSNDSTAQAKKHLEDTFDERLLKAHDGKADQKDRTRNLYTKFLARFAEDKVMLKTLETSGLLYSETFAKKAAEIEDYLGDTPYVDGGGKGKPEDTGRPLLNYGEQFSKMYGGQK